MAIKPGAKQLRFLDWEVGMFFHFGIRTFYHGHRDWDGVEMDPKAFNPEQLDCRQWLRSAKLIGAKYGIMTTKHHDGFALWPSKYTNYSVAASAWKDGKGDVVREFTDACRAEGMGVGLYYSPAQWGSSAVSFTKSVEYDDYFINQISELLTNYGKIDYLWFDGCGSAGHQYDQKRIIKAIRSMQPEITIFGMWDPDTSWVGNEDGYGPMPNDNVREMTILGEKKQVFCPFECDCKLREHWFYDLDENTTKSLDELIGMYEYSVGRGCNLLLNVGPDDRGLIPDSDVKRLSELGAEIAKRYSVPQAFTEPQKLDANTYTVVLPEERLGSFSENAFLPLCTSCILEEDITEGQRVKKFKLYASIPKREPFKDPRLYCVYSGETIGHKAIIRFPAMRAPLFRLEILESDGEANIKSFKIY